MYFVVKFIVFSPDIYCLNVILSTVWETLRCFFMYRAIVVNFIILDKNIFELFTLKIPSILCGLSNCPKHFFTPMDHLLVTSPMDHCWQPFPCFHLLPAALHSVADNFLLFFRIKSFLHYCFFICILLLNLFSEDMSVLYGF